MAGAGEAVAWDLATVSVGVAVVGVAVAGAALDLAAISVGAAVGAALVGAELRRMGWRWLGMAARARARFSRRHDLSVLWGGYPAIMVATAGGCGGW